jgi:hypothetical protein
LLLLLLPLGSLGGRESIVMIYLRDDRRGGDVKLEGDQAEFK